ncbi:MAG: hypothetical protein ABJD11_04420 [Gemmatimonadota bacterium]
MRLTLLSYAVVAVCAVPIALRAQTPAAPAAPAAPDSAALAADDAAGDVTGSKPGHISAFTEGHHGGWLFGAPHVDLNGGLYHTDGVNDAALRLHMQYAPGSIRIVEIAADLLFLPARGATPFVSGVVQLSPLPEHSPLYANVGVGLITGHNPNGDRANGWLEATAAYRTPLHDFTVFAQAGHATGSGHDFEFLVAVAHPLSPYHAPHHH